MQRSLNYLKYGLVVVIAIMFLVPLLSWAATSTTATSSQATSTIIATSTPVITPAPPIDTTPVLLSSIAQTRITNLAANVSNRLDATLRRLTNVHDRISTRLDKIAQTGADTKAASVELESAKEHLSQAADNLATIDQDVSAFVGSSNPRSGFIRLRTTYVTIYSELTLAHSALRRALDKVDTALITPVATGTATTTTP